MAPTGEALDPAMILDDWINRVANLPEEIRFLQDEIADRDRQYNDCIKIIDDRDARIQKFIKANGSHEVNVREDGYRKIIVENFDKASQLADEKVMLGKRMQAAIDRHIRHLDMQLKQLYDRAEPGFTEPDELPSLLRSSTNHSSTPSVRASSISASAGLTLNTGSAIRDSVAATSASFGTPGGGSSGGAGRGANHVQVRQAQTSQGHSASAPVSPAASMVLGRQAREGSAGPGGANVKRGPRVNGSLANAPSASSGLARHSSLGPGTPKSHQIGVGVQRAGSAGPRATTKGPGAGPGRKAGTPSTSSALAAAAAGVVSGLGSGRKKGNGSGPSSKTLSRVKRPAKQSAASSTGESELSEAESASDSNASSRRGTPARSLSHGGNGSAPGTGAGNGAGSGSGNGASSSNGDKEGSSQPQLKRERDSIGSGMPGITAATGAGNGHAASGPGGHRPGTGGRLGGAVTKHGPRGAGAGAPLSDDRMDLDEDEAGDDRKYCLCQNVSFGDMVACDNEDCPYEWFHWSCVGLKSEPNGTWYCPDCTTKMGGAAAATSSTGGHALTTSGAIPASARKGK